MPASPKHLLDALNEIVERQQAQIDRLPTELSTLRNRMPTADGAHISAARATNCRRITEQARRRTYGL